MSGEDRGPSIRVYGGRDFWPLDPRPEDVDPVDIAHSLALTCRWGGHCRGFLSDAQHCVMVAALLEEWGCSPMVCLAGLLHDAHEAYLGDVKRPLRSLFPGLGAIVLGVDRAIGARFGLDYRLMYSAEVKRADDVMLATEARDWMAGPQIGDRESHPIRAGAWPWETAERLFLEDLRKRCLAAGVTL